MLLASILFACTANEGLLGAETEWVYGLEVATSEEIPSVIEVSFTTPEDAVAWIEFGEDSTSRSTAVDAASTEHSFSVIGPGPLTEVTMRVVVEVNGQQHTSGVFTHTSGGLLPETPTFEVTVDNYDPPEDAVLLMAVYNDPSFLVMLNFDGEVIWSKSTGASFDGYGLGVLPVDGQIHYNFFEKGVSNGLYGKFSLSGKDIAVEDTPGAHHFFTIGPDDKPVWIQEDIHEDELGEVIGDQIVVGMGDEAESIFTTWDYVTFQPNPGTLPEWTHANWIEYHPDRDSYLVSTAYTDTLFELDTTGTPIRTFGGRNAVPSDVDYIFDDPGALFSRPHGINWTSKGELMVFSTVNNISSTVIYEVNDDNGVLYERWRFGEEYGYEAKALGEVHELEDGNILISWGSVGLLQVVDPTTSTVLWEAQSALEQFPTQVHYLDNPYVTR
jgi:hypothetical protein